VNKIRILNITHKVGEVIKIIKNYIQKIIQFPVF